MKHLLQAIDNFTASNRNVNRRVVVELKALVGEIREGSEEKTNIQEFYDALERLVNEIRSMTEHSAAFLQRVRKAEAPGYFEIIKKPMDLGTVLKKVKAQQYKDKATFHADISLIWDNCFEYNTWPDHPLRKSAGILRQRTDHLLSFISDLPAKREKRAASEDLDAEGDTDNDEPDDTDKTRKGLTSRKNKYGALDRGDSLQPKREPSFLMSQSRDISIELGHREDAAEGDTPFDSRDRSISPSVPLSAAGSPQKKRKLLTARTDLLPFEERPALIRSQESMQRWDMLDQSWAVQPFASTSKYTLDDPDIPSVPFFASVLPASTSALGTARSRSPAPQSLSRTASIDQPSSLQNITYSTSSHYPHATVNGFGGAHLAAKKPLPLQVQQLTGRRDRSSTPFTPTATMSEGDATGTTSTVPPEDGKDPETRWWDAVAKEPILVGVVPDLPFAGTAVDQTFSSTGLRTETSDGYIRRTMEENINKLNILRALNMQILHAKSQQQPSTQSSEQLFFNPLGPLQIDDYQLPEFLDASALESTEAPGLAFQELSNAVLVMANHSGFDASQHLPVAVFVGLVIQYLTNFGKTLRTLSDSYSGSIISPSAILLEALTRNGVPKLEALGHHLDVELGQYGSRLDLIRAKLEVAKRDLCGGLHSPLNEEDLLQEETFILGHRAPGMGIDFLGLREGLEQADIDSLPLWAPTRLFFDKASRGMQLDEQNMLQAPDLFSVEPPQVSLNASLKEDASPEALAAEQESIIASQINLLQPFLRYRLQSDMALYDDAELANDPSLGSSLPTSTTTSQSANMPSRSRKIVRPKVPVSGKIPVKKVSQRKGSIPPAARKEEIKEAKEEDIL